MDRLFTLELREVRPGIRTAGLDHSMYSHQTRVVVAIIVEWVASITLGTIIFSLPKTANGSSKQVSIHRKM
jgi:hypothetical protein